jgi:hypothetical protein
MKLVTPTFKRSEAFVKKTLSIIEKHNFPKDKYFIFLANEEEYKEYKKTVPSKWHDNFVIAVKGVGAVRNFIHSKFAKDGEHIASIDDDITDIFKKVSEQKRDPIPEGSLEGLINQLFKECEDRKARIWGVYPVQNPFFQNYNVSEDLKYIAAGFYGTINDTSEDTLVELDDKEDFERSIKYYKKYGKTVRFNYLSLGTQGYHGEGGMQVERTPERVVYSCKYLLEKYPEYCILNESKKSEWMEVKLKDRTSEFKRKKLF